MVFSIVGYKNLAVEEQTGYSDSSCVAKGSREEMKSRQEREGGEYAIGKRHRIVPLVWKGG